MCSLSKLQVLPTLPIGAERHMWSGPAVAGRFFLWAPNEIEDASAHASALSARGAASHVARSTADMTTATSVDGDSVRDARDIFAESELGFGGMGGPLTSVQSQGSAQTTPVRTAAVHACFFC
jgi:hypothetical protein